MSQNERPDLLSIAKRVSGITVQLRPKDIVDVWREMDEAEAAKFLDEHGAVIAEQMLAAGRQAAYDLMRDEGGAS